MPVRASHALCTVIVYLTLLQASAASIHGGREALRRMFLAGTCKAARLLESSLLWHQLSGCLTALTLEVPLPSGRQLQQQLQPICSLTNLVNLILILLPETVDLPLCLPNSFANLASRSRLLVTSRKSCRLTWPQAISNLMRLSKMGLLYIACSVEALLLFPSLQTLDADHCTLTLPPATPAHCHKQLQHLSLHSTKLQGPYACFAVLTCLRHLGLSQVTGASWSDPLDVSFGSSLASLRIL